MRNRTLLALSGAAALLVQPQLAAAQAACVGEDEVSAMAVYAVPSIVQSMQLRCGPQLSQQGWLARSGRAFAARYTTLQNGAWPTAKAGLLKIVNGRTQGVDPQVTQTLAMVSGLPDQNVRPLVDALIVQEVSARIPVAECGRIERVMEAIAPIDPQVAGKLIGAAAGLFAKEQPLICPTRPK